jgi:septum formation protein
MRIILASASPRRRELLEQIGLHFEVITSHVEEKVSSHRPDEVVEELSRQKAEAVAQELDLQYLRAEEEPFVDAGTDGKEPLMDVGTDGKEPLVDVATDGKEPLVDAGTDGKESLMDAGTDGKEPLVDAGTDGKEPLVDAGMDGKEPLEHVGTAVKEPYVEMMPEAELCQRRQEAVLVIGADTVVALDGAILGKPEGKQEAYSVLKSLQGRGHEVYTGVTLLYRAAGAQEWVQKCFHERTKVNFFPMEEAEIREYVNTEDPLDKAGAYGIQGFCARYISGIEGDYNNVVGLPVGILYQKIKELVQHEKSSNI